MGSVKWLYIGLEDNGETITHIDSNALFVRLILDFFFHFETESHNVAQNSQELTIDKPD